MGILIVDTINGVCRRAQPGCALSFHVMNFCLLLVKVIFLGIFLGIFGNAPAVCATSQRITTTPTAQSALCTVRTAEWSMIRRTSACQQQQAHLKRI